eukprot:TRINITY_DN389_c0_g1_i2.p1 TRINITY_DN389_c0_g1~~TRINITY_DN389_c0_g1_i2.p1  ORF type:complete len:132 (+),score=19.84 TRINITY_DN389_c0_g1_i2:329-724(+)
MMIQGIKPIWEDPANEDGGFWKIKVENKVKAPLVWRELILALVGEQLYKTEGEYQIAGTINGVSISIKHKFAQVLVWNDNCTSRETSAIRDRILSILTENNLDGFCQNPFYQQCRHHQSFSEEFAKEKKTG